MVDVKPIDVLTDRSLAQWYVEDEVYKGMKLAPLLGYGETKARRYDFFTREKTAEELFAEGVIEKPMPSAAGSELTLVNSGEMEVESTRMRQHGYRYIVENDMMEEAPEAFLQDLQDLAYGISTFIESSSAVAITSAAVDKNIALEDGNWDTSTQIAVDLSNFRSFMQRLDQRESDLDTLLYNGTNLDELRKYIIKKDGIDNLKMIGQDISYQQFMHYYIANGISEGSLYGWNSARKPGSIIYRKLKGSYEPAKIQNGAQYRPVVNMCILNHDGMRPKTEYQFGVEFAIPITRPNYLFMNNI